jgi:putative heme uptake system protein
MAEISSRAHTLIVDGPNIDQAVAGLLGRAPKRSERIRFDVLARWFADQAAGAGASADTRLFTNVPVRPKPALEAWVRALVQGGWHVFAKPRISPESDVDSDMLAHLSARSWARVVVVSHDARCFAQPLAELAAAGTEVIVVGMIECAGCLPGTEGVTFVDIEDVPGLFDQAPPRVRLSDIAEQGRWFHPATAIDHAA